MTIRAARVARTPDQQATEVERVIALSRRDASLIRCDGTHVELREYRDGQSESGWRCASLPEPGDLLLSTIGSGKARMIISLCLVENVTAEGTALWNWATDVSILPALSWNAVVSDHESGRAWSAVSGRDKERVQESLVSELRAQSDLSVEEGQRQIRNCRNRSRLNRQKMLDRSDGRCQACGLDLRELFGARGDRGLDVHHVVPLCKRGDGVVRTRMAALLVLCAVCHRLLHAVPDLSLDRLRAGWRTSD